MTPPCKTSNWEIVISYWTPSQDYESIINLVETLNDLPMCAVAKQPNIKFQYIFALNRWVFIFTCYTRKSQSRLIWAVFTSNMHLCLIFPGGIIRGTVKRPCQSFYPYYSQESQWPQTSTVSVDAFIRTCSWVLASRTHTAVIRPACGERLHPVPSHNLSRTSTLSIRSV